MAGDHFERAAKAYWQAVRHRETAAYDAYKFGLNDPWVARELSEAQSRSRGEAVTVAPSEVSRMWARQPGEVRNRARLVARAKREGGG